MANTANRALLANYITGTQATVSTGRNYVLNSLPLLGVENISVSGATVAKNTTSPLTSMGDFEISLADNATDTIYWSLAEQDEELINQNCEFRFTYRSSSIGSNVVAVVRQDTNVLNQSDVLTTTNSPQVVSINVPCTDLSLPITVGFKNDTGNSGASTIYVANLQYGRATNLQDISQASLVGTISWAGQTNCIWTKAGAVGLSAFTADADCANPTTVGNVSAPSTKIPAVVFNAEAGSSYLLIASGGFRQTGTNTAAFAFSDGTVTTGITSVLLTNQVVGTVSGTYIPTSSGSKTVQIYGAAEASTSALILSDVANLRTLTISVYKIPSFTQTVYNANTTPAWGALTYTGATNCFWRTTSSTFTNYSADADCSVPATIGNASYTGSKIPGATFNNVPAGTYLVQAFGAFRSEYSGGSGRAAWRLTDGTNFFGYTEAAAINVNDNDFTTGVSGIITYTSFQPSVTIQVQGTTASGVGNADIIANSTDKKFQLLLTPISQNLPAPQLVGSVTSNSSGLERIERASVFARCTSNPCTITSQSGNWLTSITRNSVGNYTANIATGIFSNTPTCSVTLSSNTLTSLIHQVTAKSTSAISFRSYGAYSSGAVGDDFGFDIICMGPKG